MSLIRLLTTTRSLSDVKDEPSPYRMSEQAALPKFGPREKAREDARPPRTVAADPKANLGEGNGDRTDAGCSLKSESSRKPKGLRWWQKLFRRRPRRELRGPVQAEFSLDLVKVVRNDLSEEETRDAERGTGKKDKPELQRDESVFGGPMR